MFESLNCLGLHLGKLHYLSVRGGAEDRRAGTEKSRRVLGRAKKISTAFRAGRKFFKIFFFPLFFKHRGYQWVAMHLECSSTLNALHMGVISTPNALYQGQKWYFIRFSRAGTEKSRRVFGRAKKIFSACILVLMYQMNLWSHKKAILRKLRSKLNFDRSLPPP